MAQILHSYMMMSTVVLLFIHTEKAEALEADLFEHIVQMRREN